jgi:hypothetical protein
LWKLATSERRRQLAEVTTEPAPKPSSGGSGLFSTVFGLAFLLGGVALLFMSEGSTVKRTLAAAEVRRTARSIERPLGEPDPALEGKLVHIAAPAATEDRVRMRSFRSRRFALIVLACVCSSRTPSSASWARRR